jgi:hypothetical protein
MREIEGNAGEREVERGGSRPMPVVNVVRVAE